MFFLIFLNFDEFSEYFLNVQWIELNRKFLKKYPSSLDLQFEHLRMLKNISIPQEYIINKLKGKNQYL